MNTELVFQALADTNRRRLLDLLYNDDGQTLNQLSSHLPMTRYGVSKHLDLLEGAGLIVTLRSGREKLHYLNPRHMVGAAEWINQYRRLWAERMDRLDQYLQNIQNKEQQNDPGQP